MNQDKSDNLDFQNQQYELPLSNTKSKVVSKILYGFLLTFSVVLIYLNDSFILIMSFLSTNYEQCVCLSGD
jgi:hypothetical protein